jgi:hypothetical protein
VIRRVSELEPATVGTEPLESDLNTLVEIIEHNPSDLEQFKSEFVQLVRDFPPGATEMLQFVMHRYRWEEVREEILTQLQATEDRRFKPVLERVLAAFNPNWEDRDIFAAYRAED